MFEPNEPKYTLPLGAVVIFQSGLSEPIRNLWDARVSQIAIYGRECGEAPFCLALQYADGGVVQLGEFDSFESAYRFANGGKDFDPSEEVKEGEL